MTGEQVETLEQFFTELPVLVDQATRHLHRSNLNLWGHLSRRLYDSLNVFNIPETLTTNIRMFLEELHSIHTRILNIIIFEYDFVLNANDSCSFLSAKPIYTGLGRPELRVSAVEINRVYDMYMSWKDVALHLGVSVRTLGRLQNKFNITVSGRAGSQSTYTTISDKQLCSVLREVLQMLPDVGET